MRPIVVRRRKGEQAFIYTVKDDDYSETQRLYTPANASFIAVVAPFDMSDTLTCRFKLQNGVYLDDKKQILKSRGNFKEFEKLREIDFSVIDKDIRRKWRDTVIYEQEEEDEEEETETDDTTDEDTETDTDTDDPSTDEEDEEEQKKYPPPPYPPHPYDPYAPHHKHHKYKIITAGYNVWICELPLDVTSRNGTVKLELEHIGRTITSEDTKEFDLSNTEGRIVALQYLLNERTKGTKEFKLAHKDEKFFITNDETVTVETLAKDYGGTWELLPAGYTIGQAGTVNLEDGTTETFNVGDKTGEFLHKLTVDEMPSHSHQAVGYDVNSADGSENDRPTFQTIWTTKADFNVFKINNTGGDKYHNNMPPTVFYNIFIRTIPYTEGEEA